MAQRKARLNSSRVSVLQDPEKPVPFEVMASSIEQIGSALHKIEETRVSKKLVLALVKDHTGLSKAIIEKVLNSYEELEKTYLKPRKYK